MHKKFPVKDADFKRSSYTNPGGIITRCVEVARVAEGVAVRNSNDPQLVTTYYTHDEWDAFIKGVKDGQFDARV